MKHIGLKVIAYTPMLIGFSLVYFSLDFNMAWIWRIPNNALAIFYIAILTFWYLGSWLYVKIKCKTLRKTLLQFLLLNKRDTLPSEFDNLSTPAKDLHVEAVEKTLLFSTEE